MRIIVISGSYSEIGKTTLARNISETLKPKHVEIIKFGHNPEKSAKKEKLFHEIENGLKFIQNLQDTSKIDYLIIESNSIYDFIKPDFAIFIEGDSKPEKESAKLARKYANIVLKEHFDYNQAEAIIKNKLDI